MEIAGVDGLVRQYENILEDGLVVERAAFFRSLAGAAAVPARLAKKTPKIGAEIDKFGLEVWYTMGVLG